MDGQLAHSIFDTRTLKDAAACLHDARFPSAGFRYDRPSRRFELQAWQYMPSSFTGLSRVLTCLELSFEEVVRFRQQRSEPWAIHRYYEFSTIRHLPGRQMVILNTHFDLTLFLKMERLSGQLKWTDDHTANIDTAMVRISTK